MKKYFFISKALASKDYRTINLAECNPVAACAEAETTFLPLSASTCDTFFHLLYPHSTSATSVSEEEKEKAARRSFGSILVFFSPARKKSVHSLGNVRLSVKWGKRRLPLVPSCTSDKVEIKEIRQAKKPDGFARDKTTGKNCPPDTGNGTYCIARKNGLHSEPSHDTESIKK